MATHTLLILATLASLLQPAAASSSSSPSGEFILPPLAAADHSSSSSSTSHDPHIARRQVQDVHRAAKRWENRDEIELARRASPSNVPATSTCQGTVGAYGQCGGIGYSGDTCCTSGWTCTVQNDYYSQCTPAASTCSNAFYAQCGGIGFSGSTCCPSGSACISSGAYYSSYDDELGSANDQLIGLENDSDCPALQLFLLIFYLVLDHFPPNHADDDDVDDEQQRNVEQDLNLVVRGACAVLHRDELCLEPNYDYYQRSLVLQLELDVLDRDPLIFYLYYSLFSYTCQPAPAATSSATATSSGAAPSATATSSCKVGGSGSDGCTPYTVTALGVTLPSGYKWQDGGHVNYRAYSKSQGTGSTQSFGVHFESLNNQPSGVYIGKTFYDFSGAAAAFPGGWCVSWVQVDVFNQHFGEGGQAPICTA
ncbi:hypothetical protein JCM8097_007766 [Rhodosporidiobolus ruineniae]